MSNAYSNHETALSVNWNLCENLTAPDFTRFDGLEVFCDEETDTLIVSGHLADEGDVEYLHEFGPGAELDDVEAFCRDLVSQHPSLAVYGVSIH